MSLLHTTDNFNVTSYYCNTYIAQNSGRGNFGKLNVIIKSKSWSKHGSAWYCEKKPVKSICEKETSLNICIDYWYPQMTLSNERTSACAQMVLCSYVAKPTDCRFLCICSEMVISKNVNEIRNLSDMYVATPVSPGRFKLCHLSAHPSSSSSCTVKHLV